MSDPMKRAWKDVADGFSSLGRTMKERYEGSSGDGRNVGDRAADVARDDEVKARAKKAAATLNDALSATVNLIGDEVGGLFTRSKRGGSDVDRTED